MVQAYAKSYLFLDCEDFKVPNGCHFVGEGDASAVVFVFQNSPTALEIRIPIVEFRALQESEKVLEATPLIDTMLRRLANQLDF